MTALTFRALDLTWKVAWGIVLGVVVLTVLWFVIWGGLLLLTGGSHSGVSPGAAHYAKPIPGVTAPPPGQTIPGEPRSTLPLPPK